MEKFKELLAITDRLNAPDGCPWDLQQDFFSLQPFVIEEAHELIEAVDEGDDQKIVEELGDLLYQIVFYAKIAEKTGRFTIDQIIESISAKLIRRHPHIFGDLKVKEVAEVLNNWEEIKKTEKAHSKRTSVLDGIPERLPTLTKAQKLVKKTKKAGYSCKGKSEVEQGLLALIERANAEEVDLDGALRRLLLQNEKEFRDWERK